MFIRTLWTDYGRSGGDMQTPSMLEAWDGATIEENPEGWDEAVEKAKAQFEGKNAYGTGKPFEFRIVDIEVEGLWEFMQMQFRPAKVQGKLEAVDD